VEIPCYALAEVLAEKLRAIGGQRRFAVSRDLYDIHRLIESGISVADVAPLLPAKFAARGVTMSTLDVDSLLNRRDEFHTDWERRLNYLIPGHPEVTFESAWQSAIEAIRLAQGTWK
jgi:predicted nucleotidyltransferase component of viral defense system